MHKFIYQLGTKYRNPSLPQLLTSLESTDRWEREKLDQLQLERLRELLSFAAKHSPFYTQLFRECGLDPSNVSSIADLSKLPVLDKGALVAHKTEIQSRASFAKLRFSETSGTTGQALGIYRSEEWDSATRAAMMRGYGWYGIKPWERNGYLWGYNFSNSEKVKTQLLDSLQNRFRLFSYSDDEIVSFCKRMRSASYISGYSSMIYEIAKRINSMGLSRSFPNLRMVKGTSEKIYPSYQEEVEKAFGMKMISEYGAMETGIIAFECPEGGHMHIAMEHVIVEEVDGCAVVTNLMSHSFPIIRYKLGDAIELAPDDFLCSCGRAHPVLLNVLGRVGKVVRGKAKDYPSLTFYYVFKNIALKKGIALNYQVIQEQIGHLQINIEQPYSEVAHKAIQEEMHRYFSDDVSFEVSFSQQLHTYDGKLRDFVTKLS